MPGWRTLQNILDGPMTPYQQEYYKKSFKTAYPGRYNILFFLMFTVSSFLLLYGYDVLGALLAIILITMHLFIVAFMLFIVSLVLTNSSAVDYFKKNSSGQRLNRVMYYHRIVMDNSIRIVGKSGICFPIWLRLLDVCNDILFGYALVKTDHLILCFLHVCASIFSYWSTYVLMDRCTTYIKTLSDSLDADGPVDIDELSNKLFNG